MRPAGPAGPHNGSFEHFVAHTIGVRPQSFALRPPGPPGPLLQLFLIIMAVPKKRMSRTRKLLRNNQWKVQIRPQALKALSLAKSVDKKTENTSTNEES